MMKVNKTHVYAQWRAEGGGERGAGPGHPKSEITKIKML